MRVLIACEESQEVCKAFRKKGHEAFSCDIKDQSGGHPEWHLKMDVFEAINYYGPWDLMIAHPPCTYLTGAAEWAYKDGPYHQKVKPDTIVGEARRQAREESLRFVRDLMNAPIPKKVIENPVGTISSRIFYYVGGESGIPRYEVFPRKTIGFSPTQIIHPWMFGDDASKSTCLWLIGDIQPLVPTDMVQPRLVNGKKRWGNQTDSGQNNCSPDPFGYKGIRAKLRSKTYPGIAKAMADQWG